MEAVGTGVADREGGLSLDARGVGSKLSTEDCIREAKGEGVRGSLDDEVSCLCFCFCFCFCARGEAGGEYTCPSSGFTPSELVERPAAEFGINPAKNPTKAPTLSLTPAR